MAEDRRSAIGNERVGARLGRLFQRNRTQEERDILEAYRRQVPVSEIQRQREAGSRSRMGGESSGMAESAQAGSEAAEARSASPAPSTPRDEVRAAAATRNAARTQRRPDTRMSPRAAADGMSEADMLNQRELDRIGLERIRDAEREEERRRLSAAASQRTESMGGSGDIGAASARARGEQVGPPGDYNMKKGGVVKKMAKGGVVKKMATGGASRRGDGCAARGKTKGRMV